MTALVIVLLPIAVAVVLGWLVVAYVGDPPTRMKLLWWIAASLLLCFWTVLLGACGVRENTPVPHPERCGEGYPLLPLVGIPLLFLIIIVAGPKRGLWPWVIGALIFAASVVIPQVLLRN